MQSQPPPRPHHSKPRLAPGTLLLANKAMPAEATAADAGLDLEAATLAKAMAAAQLDLEYGQGYLFGRPAGASTWAHPTGSAYAA